MNTEVKEVQKEAQTVVTSENLQQFNLNKLGFKEEPKEEPKEPEALEEEKEVEEFEKEEPEEPKDEKKEEEKEPEEEPKKPKTKLEKRFSELTRQREEARKEAQAAREAQEALAKRLEELENKINPPKEPPSNRPNPANYTDYQEYESELLKWQKDEARKEFEREFYEKQQKEHQEKTIKNWEQKVSKTKEVVEDFDEVVSGSDVKVSDQVRDAILESDIGPEIIYYFAKNPDVVERISGMNVLNALREVGKIEAKLESKQPVEKKVSVSKAPPPISPIKGGAVPENKIDENGEFRGTPAEYRELRRLGKIK